MSKPETKVVLKRAFTWNRISQHWVCHLAQGGDLILSCRGDFNNEHWLAWAHGQTGRGPTESAAILALQSQLRKMAELEVVE